MKWLMILLAMLIFGLSVMPCGDDPSVVHEDHIALANSHQHQDQHTTDHCSPMCVCQCCHTNLMVDILQVELNTSRVVFKPHRIYISSLVKGITTSILQPPQA